jgi:hypothetical protein
MAADAKPRASMLFRRRVLAGKRSLRVTVPIALILIAGGVAVITLTPKAEFEPHETTQQVVRAMQHLNITEARARLRVLRADILAERPRAQLLEQINQVLALLEGSMVETANSGVDWGAVQAGFDQLRLRIRDEDAGAVETIDELLMQLAGAS